MSPVPWSEWLRNLMAGRELAPADVTAALTAALHGDVGEAELSAFIVAWRMKGETARELAAAATVLHRVMQPLPLTSVYAIDTCGTGGDGTGTFNISTATALVVAGTGLPVVKHGNRAVSSRSGSADVLTALGVALDGGPQWAAHTLAECGCAFCFAPHFHPVLARLAGLRKRLGVRTTFNLLGPLLNPARAPLQLLGVGDERWLDPLAGALAQLGGRRALVVWGGDGLDEITLSGLTQVRLVERDKIIPLVWQPADFGLPVLDVADLRADDADASAAIIRNVLTGAPGPATDIVLANAAAALWLAQRVPDLPTGVAVARSAITAGAAQNVLNCLAKPWSIR